VELYSTHNTMVRDPKKSYVPTPSKFYALWELANRLHGEYMDFDKQLSALENKYHGTSSKIIDITTVTGPGGPGEPPPPPPPPTAIWEWSSYPSSVNNPVIGAFEYIYTGGVGVSILLTNMSDYPQIAPDVNCFINGELIILNSPGESQPILPHKQWVYFSILKEWYLPGNIWGIPVTGPYSGHANVNIPLPNYRTETTYNYYLPYFPYVP